MDCIDNSSTFYSKFKTIALESSFSWRVHPWESIGDSFESHMVGLLGWAIANKHSPLFELMRDPASPKLSCERMYSTSPSIIIKNMPLLHLAARMGFIPAVEELLHLSKPRLLDHKRRLAIHHAAETGSVRAMEVLLRIMKDYVNDQDINGHSTLHLAAIGNCYAVVDTLVRRSKIIPDLLDFHSRTPLFYALQNLDITVVELLLYMRASVNWRDIAGQTPVFVAAARLNARGFGATNPTGS
ncbi:ankyrin repeat-containing domain protein [Aspergillus insuetus]